jgi:hypothetical protein
MRRESWRETRLMMESISIPELHPLPGIQRSNFLKRSARLVLKGLNFSLYAMANKKIEDITDSWKADEPRFGAFCAVLGINKEYIYLYGHTPDNLKSVVLARVPSRQAFSRKEYEYWDGNGWSSKMRESKPVLTAMQHGQIFHTDIFGQNSPFKYAFIGCNSFADSKVRFGRAQEPQGPWEQIHEVEGLRTYSMQPYDPASFIYCFYPHPWAFDVKKNGDLMITWSEGGMHGSVIAELLRFETTT